MKIQQIENNEHLIKDNYSRSIINNNKMAFEAAKHKKKQKEDAKIKLKNIDEKVDNIIIMMEKMQKEFKQCIDSYKGCK